MGRGAQRPGEDTGYQHLALDGCMAGWHRVGPLRGLLLNPVAIRDGSRRWEDDAAQVAPPQNLRTRKHFL